MLSLIFSNVPKQFLDSKLPWSLIWLDHRTIHQCTCLISNPAMAIDLHTN